MEYVPDWSGLPSELLEKIAKCLPVVEDFTAFRGVCTTWRASILRKNNYQFKVPLLMLAEKHRSHAYKNYVRNLDRKYRIQMEGKGLKCKIDRKKKYCKIDRLCKRKKKHHSVHEREFYSLSKRKICARLPFPDAKNKKCIYAGYGWILAVSASKCSKLAKYGRREFVGNDNAYGKFGLGDISDGKVSLVKPFYSSPKIKLPNLTKLPKYEESGRWPDFNIFLRAMLLANPSKVSDFMLVLLTDNFIVFWRNGDANWTVINLDIFVFQYCDMVYYKGYIYAMDGRGRIWIWDPKGKDLTKAQVMMQLDNHESDIGIMMYLVESTEGELLVIMRNNTKDSDKYMEAGANYFRVMRVDLEARKFEEIKSIGKDAIFVGNNTTVAVAADDYPGVLQSNCIYFTDDCIDGYFYTPACPKGGGKDMGIYSVEDGRIERLGIKSFSPISPPMWIFPSF